MAYLIVNTGKTEGTVHIKDGFKVLKPGERLTSDSAPTGWSRFIRVVKQIDQPHQDASPERSIPKSRVAKTEVQNTAAGGAE